MVGVRKVGPFVRDEQDLARAVPLFHETEFTQALLSLEREARTVVPLEKVGEADDVHGIRRLADERLAQCRFFRRRVHVNHRVLRRECRPFCEGLVR